MKDYAILLKWQLKHMYKMEEKSKFTKSALFNSLMVGLCFLPLIVLVCVSLVSITPIFFSLGLASHFINCIIGITQSVVFFFGLMSIIGNMYFSRDNEFLASLPVKSSSIFLSKFTMVYISELMVAALVLLPVLLTVGISAQVAGFGVNWVYYILLPFIILFTPFAPLFLISVLSMPIMYLVSFFKKRAALSGIIGIFIFIGVMAAYFAFTMNMNGNKVEDVIQQLKDSIIGMSNIFIFNIFMVKAMLLTDAIINIVIHLAIIIGFFGISCLISSAFYKKAQVIQLETNITKRKKYKEDKVSVNVISPEMAIFKRDLKLVVREPALAFNSFMGPLLSPILISFVAKPMFGNFAGNNAQYAAITSVSMILFYSLMLLCGTNYFANIAFSREGDKYYINKYLPIDLKKLAKGKLLLADAVSFIGIALTAIAAIISIKMNFIIAILFIATLLIYAISFNYMGLYRDMKNPKLEWTNLQQITKKNFSAVVPMFIGMAIGLGLLILSLVLVQMKVKPIWCWVMIWSIADVIGIILLIISKTKFDQNVYKFLDRIEC